MHAGANSSKINRKIIRGIVFPLLPCIFPLFLIAQKQHYYFYGKVIDRETRYPVSSANIRFTGSNLGTTTNPKGEFSFIIDTIPVFMIVSHLGYETQQIWLDNTSASLKVLLRQQATLLPEVEIKATPEPVQFFKDKSYAVLDYEVDSNRVFLIIYRFRLAESEVLCLSVMGDTVARSGALPFRPSALFRDCLGNVHVFSHDSAFQLFQDSVFLHLIYPTDIKRFRKILFDCVASTDKLLFFKQMSRDQLGVEFYHIDRQTSQRQHLTRADDEERMKMLRRNPGDNALLMMSRIPEGRESFQQWSWVKKVLYKPNTSTLHKLDDILCVFNTADGTLELYTLNGEFTAKLKMPVQEVREGRWTNEICIDEVTHQAYTSFLKNGEFTLYRIDLNTGNLKRIVTARHMFPQKVRIHQNFLFYLYDVPGMSDNKHMYRQKL